MRTPPNSARTLATVRCSAMSTRSSSTSTRAASRAARPTRRTSAATAPGSSRRARKAAENLVGLRRHGLQPGLSAELLVVRPAHLHVAAVAALVGCLLLGLSMLNLGLDDLDEGYFVEQATRVLAGQVPYRD